MKHLLLISLTSAFALSSSAQNAKEGPGEMPKGKLMYYEYNTNNNHNFLYESFTAERKTDGKIRVTVYDFYQDIDSVTVEGNEEVMNHINEVLADNMKRQDLRGNITWLNGETGNGQTHHFTAIFDSGDTLRMNGYIRRYGFGDLETYLIDYAKSMTRKMDFKEITGEIPEHSRWHNGIEEFYYQPRTGTIEKRYKVGSDEIIVVTGAKSKRVLDVYYRLKEQYDESLQNCLVELISGVYENEKGQSVFGKVERLQDEKYYSGDPGAGIKFKWDGRHYTDTISWGESRMQQRTYEGGHGGALSGPTIWRVKYIDEGLEVWELETGMYAPTHPDFGKHFKLKKIRGPYKHTKDLWAIASEKPLTRGQLLKLTPKQRQAMLNEIQKRHSDGSKLTEIENLNKKLIEGLK